MLGLFVPLLAVAEIRSLGAQATKDAQDFGGVAVLFFAGLSVLILVIALGAYIFQLINPNKD